MDQHHANEPSRSQDTATTVSGLVEHLAQELRPHTMGTLSVTLDSSLERELGFDSLGRVELIGRLDIVSRLVFRPANLPLQVQGLEHLPQNESFVLVANHAS